MQKRYTKVMFFGFIVFISTFLFTLFGLNPQRGTSTIIVFYVSLLISITCFLSIFIFFIRKKISNNELYFANIKVSFRQSLLLATFVGLTLFLASIRLLTWWDIILLALSLILLELYFESSKVKPIDNKRQTI